MKKEAIKDYFIVNGEIVKVENSNVFAEIEKPSIYEVIRIIDGIPLFAEEHLERIYESAKLIDYNIDVTSNEIKDLIKKIIVKNDVENLNIKLLFGESIKREKMFLVYFIESFYPPEGYYKDGIHTILYEHERENPNAKVLITSFKDQVSKELDKNNAFEALLVNSSGDILEGSRSNMFFVKNDKVYTAKSANVLLGITRKYILKICKKLNIEIVEESIKVDDIQKLQGAFMTGTSVDVLPIATIGNIKLSSTDNEIINAIKDSYKIEMKNYINKNIKNC